MTIWKNVARVAMGATLAACVGRGFPSLPPDGGGPDGAASAARLVAPAAGSLLPTNTRRIVVEGAAAPSIEGVPSTATLWDGCDGCVAIDVGAPLAARATYRILDGGAPTTASFTTGDGPDTTAPSISVAYAATDGCASIRIDADEPVFVRLIAAGRSGPAIAADGFATDVGTALPPGEYAITAVATDLAGHEASDHAELAVTDRPFAISEVLSNARGVEPAQEWVELENVSGSPASLLGWRLGDAQEDEALPDVTLSPGERALVVPSDFDASGPGGDVAPAPGTPIVRLERASIGHAGLANSGELVILRDVSGLASSTFSPHYDQSSPSWAGRSVERIEPAGCDLGTNYAPNATHSATPGRKNSVEP
jgi:hypothetical protein